MNRNKKTALRIFPENWIYHCDFKKFFKNPNFPFEVDVGSGKGRFLLERSKNNPKTNFLGIERQLLRVNRSGRKCEKNDLGNVRILRMECSYAIKYLIPNNYVDNFYIFFPDPWPKDRHISNRLLNSSFVDSLYRTLVNKGCLHFSTDHLPYFESTYNLLINDKRFNEVNTFIPLDHEKTDFELLYSSSLIGRCSFEKS